MESGVVGYAQSDIVNGWNFATVMFKNVDEAKNYDLLDIVPKKADGSDFDTKGGSGRVRCMGSISVQKISSGGAYLDSYYYYSTLTDGTLDGWYTALKDEGGVKLERNKVMLEPGQGLIVSCTVEGGAKLQSSGGVELQNTLATLPNGWAFSGNATPVEIDLLDIVPKKIDGSDFDTKGGSGRVRCMGSISVQKISAGGAYLDSYYYYSTLTDGELDGWYTALKDEGGQKVSRNTLKFAPGEGMIVSCTVDGGAKLSFPSPIK